MTNLIPTTEKPSTMAHCGIKSGARLIASGTPSEQLQFLNDLTKAQIRALPFLFDFWALPHQLPPEGDWRTWVILGGRGAGKTRAGAEWVRSIAEGPNPTARGRASRIALVADTYDQAREVMIFGESGILAISPPDRKPDWIATRRMLVWPNGAQAQVFTSQDPEGLRGPQFDAAWVDEFGCAAIDKGTNQPNKFLDPKSSESSLPYYSSGARDDVIQMQYLRAIYRYYGDTTNNPVSMLYDAPMLEMARAHVWAWDTRPFPEFPAAGELWSDGENYARGHWLNGRSSSRTLASVVTELCNRSGVEQIDVRGLHGIVRGYAVSDIATARSALQPLIMAYAIEVSEKDGKLVFTNRQGAVAQELDAAFLAFDPEAGTELTQIRTSEVESPGRVQIGYLDADANYEAAVSETIHPEDRTLTVSRSEFPMALLRSEGAQIADRWVHEARAGRETIRFGLPPSNTSVGAGDVVSLNDARYRVDRIEESGLRLVEASRITQEAYEPMPYRDGATQRAPYIAPSPVEFLFMDLPMLAANTEPQQPYAAVTGTPWPGTVAIYGSSTLNDYVLQSLVSEKSVIGQTQTAIKAGALGRWDRQSGIEVRLASGGLSSAEQATILSGTNAIAIGDGSADGWEIMQFQSADLIDLQIYRISNLLRGQFGSDAHMPQEWPAGSFVVLLDQLPNQVTIPTSSLGTPRNFRFGPASRPINDPNYRAQTAVFNAEGWRPYKPVHLKAAVGAGGLTVSWVRRSRVQGDNWATGDIPIGEMSELYQIEIHQAGTVRRQTTVPNANWTYESTDMAVDLDPGSFEIAVAQVSDRYGAGPSQVVTSIAI